MLVLQCSNYTQVCDCQCASEQKLIVHCHVACFGVIEDPAAAISHEAPWHTQYGHLANHLQLLKLHLHKLWLSWRQQQGFGRDVLSASWTILELCTQPYLSACRLYQLRCTANY